MGERDEKEPIAGVEEDVKPAKPAVELPGRRLRAEREASQLSREEVAHHLRLDSDTIQALEEDNYSQLPSPAYICGYLRSYAKLLKLPENEIVEAYNHGELIISELTPAVTDILPLKQAKSGLLKNIILVAVVLIVVAGLYWLAGQFGIFSSSGTSDIQSVAQTDKQLVVPLAHDETANRLAQAKPPESTQAAKPSSQSSPKPEKNISSANKLADSGQAPKPETPAGKTVIEKLPVPKSKIPGSEPAKVAIKPTPAKVASQTVTKSSAVIPFVTNDSAQTAQLHLHFNDDSWAEVTDSTGNRLVYHLIEKNTDLDLDGVPPFTVLLGNASAVQVFYQGKEFDHSQYRHDQVASFKVGG